MSGLVVDVGGPPRIDSHCRHLLSMLIRARSEFVETAADEETGACPTAEMAAWTAAYRGIQTAADARGAVDELIQLADPVYTDSALFTDLDRLARHGLSWVQLAQELVIPLVRDNLLLDEQLRAEDRRRRMQLPMQLPRTVPGGDLTL
jgi:hypothetical protein